MGCTGVEPAPWRGGVSKCSPTAQGASATLTVKAPGKPQGGPAGKRLPCSLGKGTCRETTSLVHPGQEAQTKKIPESRSKSSGQNSSRQNRTLGEVTSVTDHAAS